MITNKNSGQIWTQTTVAYFKIGPMNPFNGMKKTTRTSGRLSRL
jgi:hypothetical protein